MTESFDALDMNRKSSREIADEFVPVEEIPDTGQLTPLEALIAKESQELEVEQNESEEGVDPHDLTRAPSYVLKDTDSMEQFADVPGSEVPDGTAEIAEGIDGILLKGKKTVVDRINQSHGVRGKVPPSKNRMSQKLNSVEGKPGNN